MSQKYMCVTRLQYVKHNVFSELIKMAIEINIKNYNAGIYSDTFQSLEN